MQDRLAICGGTPAVRGTGEVKPSYQEEERRLLEVLHSGVWGGYSAAVREFETRFGSYIGGHCVSVSNGTVSLEVALCAEGIGPGDEVIVPPYTFMATASAVLQTGALPVFADVEHGTLNLDPERVEAAITPRTRALIPVHFGGHAADMDRLLDIAGRRGLVVIEDAAHAHGGEHNGHRLGGLADWGSFSFQQSKIMTAGEGGCLVTRDEKRAASARSYSNQGRIQGGAWYDHHILGTNLRMTGLQAALLLPQLDRLDEETAARNRNAAILRDAMGSMDGLKPLMPAPYCTRHALALFLSRFDAEKIGVSKALFEAALKAEGVPVMETYPRPLYGNPIFEKWPFRNTGCPVAEAACREIVTLPFSLLNGSREMIDGTIVAIRKVVEHADQLQLMHSAAPA